MDWILEEMRSLTLGDERLNIRAKKILSSLSKNPTDSIPTSCSSAGDMKAAYRFFDNNKASSDKIQESHFKSTISRMSKHAVVLIPQDTTVLNFTSQQSRSDAGPTTKKSTRGIFLHSAIAVTVEGLCLGHVSTKQWFRSALQNLTNSQKNKKNYSTPIENKESYRWLENYRQANEYAKILPNTMVVSIADREGDIYDIYKEAQEATLDRDVNKTSSTLTQSQTAHYLIRAQHNRKLCSAEGERINNKIKASLKSDNKLGEMEVNISGTPNRDARKAQLSVFSKRVFIDVPDKYKKKDGDVVVELTAILCCEDNSAKERDKIEWLLLTDLPVKTFEEACEKIKWYSCRWQIEIFFKVLKSGCTIEKLQITDANFSICLSFYLIIAWRILYIVAMGRYCPDISCESVFRKEEWQITHIITKRQKPGRSPPKLNDMVRMVASLGGYVNKRSAPEPGVKTVWIGLKNMQEHLKAREAIDHVYGRCG